MALIMRAADDVLLGVGVREAGEGQADIGLLDVALRVFVGGRAEGTRQSGVEVLRRQVGKMALGEAPVELVGDVAGDHQRHPPGCIEALAIGNHLVPRDAFDHLREADHPPTQRGVAIDRSTDQLVDLGLRIVLVHLHFFEHDAALALHLFGGDQGIAEHVGDDVDRLLGVVGCTLHVVRGVLLAGEGVEAAAQGVDLGGDLQRCRPARCSLEEEVLQEVGGAGHRAGLVAGPGADEEHRRHRARAPGHGEDGEAVVEGGDLRGTHDRLKDTGRFGTRSQRERRPPLPRAGDAGIMRA